MSRDDRYVSDPANLSMQALITAILESRRTYQLAMALAKQLLLNGEPGAMVAAPIALCVDVVTKSESTRQTRDVFAGRQQPRQHATARRRSRSGLRLVASDPSEALLPA